LALDTGLSIYGLLQCALARLVVHDRAALQLVQVEMPERVLGTEGHRLGPVAFSPATLVADDRAGRSVRVDPVDAVDPGRADRFPLSLDDPPHIVLRFTDALDEVLLLR